MVADVMRLACIWVYERKKKMRLDEVEHNTVFTIVSGVALDVQMPTM